MSVKVSPLAFFSLIPTFLFAQPDRAIFNMTLEEILDVEVTTASRAKDKITEAPATVYVITADDIEKRGYSNLLEVLEDIPEFEIQERNNTENYSLVSVRGIQGQERMLIMMDGVNINSMAGSALAVGDNYNVKGAEKIEILMGPASVIYGGDAFAGVVNIITKSGDKIKGAEAYASYGMYNTTDNSLTFGFGNEEFSLVAGGSFFRSPDPYLPKYYPLHYQWYTEQYLTGANALAGPFSNDTVTIAEGVQPWDRTRLAYTGHIKMMFRDLEVGANFSSFDYSSSNGARPEYSVSDAESRYGSDVFTLYAKHNWESPKKNFSIANQLVANLFSLNPNSTFLNSFSNYEHVYKYAQDRGTLWNTTFNFQLNEHNRLTGGINYKYITALPKTSDLPVEYDPSTAPEGDPDYYYLGTDVQDTMGRDLTMLQNFYFYNEHTFGISAQYQTNIQNKLFLTVAGRADYNTRFGWTFNPKVGLVMKPVDNFNIKLSYVDARLQPSPAAAFQHFGTFFFNQQTNRLESFFFHLPNPDLQAAKIRTGELDFTYLKKDISFSVGGFFNLASNIPWETYVSDTTFQGAHIYTAEITKNVKSQQTYGGTARIEYRKNFDNDSEINTYGSFSYIQGKFGDLDMPFTSPYSFKFGVFYRIKKFSVSLRGMYRGKSEGLFYSETMPTDILPGETVDQDDDGSFVRGAKPYFMLNAYLKYRVLAPGLGPNSGRFTMDLFVKVRNATNARYYHPGSGTADVFAAVPQDPIRITAGIFVKFAK